MRGSGRLLRLSAFALAFMAVACSSGPPEDRPAFGYASIEELADALGPLCTDFEDRSQRVKSFQFGRCREAGAKPGSLGLSISVFPDDSEYDKRKEDDATGCNGPMIYGPNWNVGPLGFGDIPKVLDAVGGEIVGSREEQDC